MWPFPRSRSKPPLTISPSELWFITVSLVDDAGHKPPARVQRFIDSDGYACIAEAETWWNANRTRKDREIRIDPDVIAFRADLPPRCPTCKVPPFEACRPLNAADLPMPGHPGVRQVNHPERVAISRTLSTT